MRTPPRRPIGITVEGANILTRSMIIFGQGAIRCHPYALDEMESVAERDLARFDRAFFGHVGFVLSNAARALWLGLTGARLARVPEPGRLRRPLQQLTRWSVAFALRDGDARRRAPEEREWLREADEARDEAVQVDAFEAGEFERLRR